MKARALIALALTGLLVAAITAPAVAGKSKATVVAKDAEGDWGDGTIPAQVGSALGMDLVGAEISGDSKTINFVIKVAGLPPNGGTPELARYIWSVNVDGEYVELDGKWSNYSRGACDPTSGQCPPPRNPGMQPFLIRANCKLADTGTVTTCEEVGIVQAVFDAAAGTITIPVPGDIINVKKGSKITAGSSDFTSGAGGTIIAVVSAFLSTNNPATLDAMLVTKTFVVKK